MLKRDLVCIVLGFLTLVAGIAIYAIFEFSTILPVTERGFFCNDPTIRYHKNADTIPDWLALLLFFALPAIGFGIFEGVRGDRYTCLYTQIHFNFAWILSGLLCDSMKLIVGRLRPFFLELCLPGKLLDDVCGPPESRAAENRYILDYKCTNATKAKYLYHARKSFPSGHTQIAVFGAVFICIYVWERLPARPPYWFRHICVFLVMFLAVVTAITRIKDYKHHPEDVVVGAMIGIFFGVFGGLVWRRAIEAHYAAKAKADSGAKSEEEEAMQLGGEGESPPPGIAIVNNNDDNNNKTTTKITPTTITKQRQK